MMMPGHSWQMEANFEENPASKTPNCVVRGFFPNIAAL